MFRVSAFLMATLLLFSATPIGLAQQNSVQAQAAADASADMSDMSKAKWFLLGGIGSTMGCFLGYAGGCLLGSVNPGSTSDSLSDTQWPFACAGAVLLGVCAVPIAVFVYPHNVTPPQSGSSANPLSILRLIPTPINPEQPYSAKYS